MTTSSPNFSLQFPSHRPRRARRHAWSRSMVQETVLTPANFIYPVFVQEGSQLKTPVPSMPGVFRYSLDLLIEVAKECVDLGIPVMALFPSLIQV